MTTVSTRTEHWEDIRVFPSSDQNVQKFVFTTGSSPSKKAAVAEAVLYKYPTYEARTVICCSVMSGCPIGCRFCGTGDMFGRNLTANEIVEQVAYLLSSQSIDATAIERFQIMFMSMGEPMLNQKHLAAAIRELNVRYPQAALLISTSAPRVSYEWLRDLSQEIPQIGLQFSVHESTDQARNILIPFREKLTLQEIANEGEQWAEATGRQPFFNYCVGPANGSDLDARRLATLFDPHVWQATVSVICEPDESIAAANERQRELASSFMLKLVELGFSVRMFDPAGQDDIGGGCGQLWYVQDWMQQHPGVARPSVGDGLPKVHAPLPA